MNWWWTIFHSKFKLYIPYIIIIPWIVRKSTLIDATKLPPLFEGVSSSTREDTFCGKLVERGFQNRELSDAEEGLKELEGKTIKWHSTEGGRGRRRKFPVANFFRNSWLTQHSARIMSKIVEISAVKSTLCTAVEENLLSIPKIELNALSKVLILYIYYLLYK